MKLRCFSLNSKLDFGKFKGVSVLDLYQGASYLSRQWIREVIEQLILPEIHQLDMEARKNAYFKFNDKYVDFSISNKILTIGASKKCYEFDFGLDWIVLYKFENIIADFLIKKLDAHLVSLLGERNKPLAINYDKIFDGLVGDEKETQVAYGNPYYISWLIENVDSFLLNPKSLKVLEGLPINSFEKIDFVSLGNSDFYYYQVKKVYRYEFLQKVHEINQNKWDAYVVQMIDEARMHRVKDAAARARLDIYYNEEDVEENDGYSDGYGGSLKQDYIDDAFGGEADAQWNID